MCEKIKAIRKALGMSQEEFGESVKFSGGYISALEKGRKIPSEHAMEAIMLKHRVNPEWWEDGTGEMFLTRKEPPKDDLVRLAEVEFEKLLGMVRDDSQRLELQSDLTRFLSEQHRKLRLS